MSNNRKEQGFLLVEIRIATQGVDSHYFPVHVFLDINSFLSLHLYILLLLLIKIIYHQQFTHSPALPLCWIRTFKPPFKSNSYGNPLSDISRLHWLSLFSLFLMLGTSFILALKTVFFFFCSFLTYRNWLCLISYHKVVPTIKYYMWEMANK
jgi:hypothetical protein